MSPNRHYRGTNEAARVIMIVADVLAVILGLWILMYLLDANRGNDLVQFVHDAASWLAGWSHDLFTSDEAWARVVAGYGARGRRSTCSSGTPWRTGCAGTDEPGPTRREALSRNRAELHAAIRFDAGREQLRRTLRHVASSPPSAATASSTDPRSTS